MEHHMAGEFAYLLKEDQNPAVVEQVCSRVQAILASRESIEYVAVQKRLLTNPNPEVVVLTNRRFIICRPKLFGRIAFQDHPWRDLTDFKLDEGILGSTLSFQVVGGASMAVSYLPKSQARRLYGIAQEKEETGSEERRRRQLEETHAASGGVIMQAGDLSPNGTPADPVERLKKLKQMFNSGLISPEEYEAKKADILSGM